MPPGNERRNPMAETRNGEWTNRRAGELSPAYGFAPKLGASDFLRVSSFACRAVALRRRVIRHFHTRSSQHLDQVFDHPIWPGVFQDVRRRAMLPYGITNRLAGVRVQRRLSQQAGEKAR